MKPLSICVLGGTGFVGSHLCTELGNRGHSIKILTRRREQHRELLVLPSVQIIESDIYNENQLKTHFHDCDVVINLVGILNEKGRRGKGFHIAHVELARKIVATCLSCKVPRLLHMSALNADPNGKSFYLRTKGEAENYVHTFAANKIAVTSFRPSVIFGPEDDFLNRFASILKFSLGIFPLACANARFAPVYIGDVVNVMANAIENPETFGQRINLCGPTQYSLKQLVDYIVEIRGYKTKIIGLPVWASKMQAHVLEFAPGKPFSIDNYNSLQTDSICGAADTCPTPLEAIAPDYLLSQSKYSEYQNFRANYK